MDSKNAPDVKVDITPGMWKRFTLNGIILHADGIRSNSKFASINNAKKKVHKHSFVQNTEKNIKKHEFAEVKAANEVKTFVKKWEACDFVSLASISTKNVL